MAEISLRVYQDRIADLAEAGRFDEVIAHARHILKRLPKNLRAYEQLGGALFAKGRWAEAADVLRRALGAKPQDYAIHLRLAQSYQHSGQHERAIWHAERALDQMPNDAEATGLIRALYRQHRGEEIERLQLTAGALAQQHIRGNLLPEALDTLDAALERNPERLDLRLLRARALWLDGRRMDAAESAIEILEQLPYAIDANRIMTELWLAEQRPTDAQTYLRRIEELDPYMARQLAAGAPAADDLLPIDELDYSSISSREQAIVDPQWLNEQAGTDSGLGALFGIEDLEAAENELVTTDLDDLLSDEQIETLFSELVIGEAVAEVSDAAPEDDAEPIAPALDEGGFLAIPPPETAADEDAADYDAVLAQMSSPEQEAAEDESEDFGAALDDELANLLEQLDDDSEDGEDGDWMAEIQQSSLELGADDDSAKIMDDFDRDWVKQPDDEETSGAPWLSAAMREALDQDEDGDLDLFGDDEQLQNLLNKASDTEPIHRSDIEDWLTAEQDLEPSDEEEPPFDITDELIQSPPADSWLDDQDEIAADDPNRENAALIDSWQSELGADEDDDPLRRLAQGRPQ